MRWGSGIPHRFPAESTPGAGSESARSQPGTPACRRAGQCVRGGGEKIANRLGCAEQAVHAEFSSPRLARSATAGCFSMRRTRAGRAISGEGARRSPAKSASCETCFSSGALEPAFCLGRVVEPVAIMRVRRRSWALRSASARCSSSSASGGDVGERFGFFGGVNNADEPVAG